MTPRKPKGKAKRRAGKPGRPPKSAALVAAQQDELLLRHANGETVTAITASMGLSCAAPWRWEDDDPDGFGKRYARARQHNTHVNASKVVDISDGTDERSADFARAMLDAVEGADPKDKEHVARALSMAAVQRDRLRMDARKWHTGKVMPKVYGDKIDVTSDNKPLNSGVLAVPVPVGADQWASMAAAQQGAK